MYEQLILKQNYRFSERMPTADGTIKGDDYMAEENKNSKENKGYGWVATGSLIGGSLPLITRKIKKGLTPDGDDKSKKKDKKKKSKKPRYILNKKSAPKKLAKQKKRLKKKAKGKLPKKLKK
ncbi:hypothetical protein SAMN05421781_0440 [Marinococcus luteus]|uniref:Uncharacterized protein n=2 Tax=Marinococcus luteus TaxID=1122204 RepID=A0A1H2QSP0_9BACI|nr:hypothetical protein SAMN05421781_0440 [Marinococcus luteus]